MAMDNHPEKRIVVVGAGIVGASLAYHLAVKNAKVTVIDAGAVASGVTGRSFAWINTSHAEPDPIHQLRSAAIEDYQRLEAQLPGLEIRWTGALSYSADTLNAAGSDNGASVKRLTTPQILELEPHLKNPPQYARYAAAEGALDAVAATHALIAGAQQCGADVFTQTRVTGFTKEDNKVTGVMTDNGIIAADIVVLAAGTGSKALAKMLDVSLPVSASPAIFIRYTPQPGLVKTLISSPDMEVRQAADGTLLAAEDYIDDAVENQPAAIALRAAKAIQSELHGVSDIEVASACVGLRPMPADGVPVVGYLPTVGGVYVCAMHPGVVLAAVVGRLASEEIIDNTRSSALAPCRPDRFFKT